MKRTNNVTVIKETLNYINDEKAECSNTFIREKAITKEDDMSCRFSCKELEEEASFCFVLGYN
jgi:hypothetical protein